MARYLPMRKIRQIRLLHLEHISVANLSDHVQGKLIVVSLDDPQLQTTHPYTALSYVWGEPESDNTIIINGWSCRIRANLASFFSHYRKQFSASSTPWLWIDALCIDQQSSTERNSQVRLMAEIYSLARTVLVWLGPADISSEAVTALLHRCKVDRWVLQNELTGPDGPRLWDALLAWCSREYWSRTWIIQEFLLGRDVQLLCGTERINGAMAEALCESARLRPRERTELMESRGLELLSQRRQRRAKRPLLELILSNREAKCQDPHDKIFAMLGLVSDAAVGRSINVDYEGPLSVLFEEVLVFCKIPEKDIFRFAYLLKHVLELESISPPVPPHPSCGIITLSAHGYITGKVVLKGERADQPLEMHQGKGVSPSAFQNITQTLRQKAFTQKAQKTHRVDWIHFLDGIDMVDMSRISVPPRVLQAISTRSFSTATCTRTRSAGAPADFAGAVAWFSGRALRSFVAGLSFGQCEKGEAIVQLPGFDMAFTMSLQPSPHFTGTLICPQWDVLQPTKDVVTFEESKFDFIRSPADCSTSDGVVKFHLTSEELLEIL
jgi:hypothetical protein